MKIGLFCAAGFSTGMLVNNMKVPIAVIPMADYGMLDGKKVLNLALELIDAV